MRTRAEIVFRLRQEAANLALYLRPPRQAPPFQPMPLPAPAAVASRLRSTPFAAELVALAEQILDGRVPLLGYEIRLGREIHWRRDSIHDRETPPAYFRRIRYLDFTRAGDHKVIWELNRHQHLVALCQAALLSGRDDFADAVFPQLESWLDQNPVCRGINWTSALEVAFRALSWIWIQHLAGHRMPAALAARWRLSLYHHGCFLDRNLSIYFSPNTHLQGEALALHALGILFDVEPWKRRGAALLREMIETHVYRDGAHFEHSSYYHVYSLDMFLLHAILAPPDDAYRERLRAMARYLWALAGAAEMPFLGDDDGGRLFFPFGERSRFPRATLAACAAFLGDTPSHGCEEDLAELAVWWIGDRARTAPPSARESTIFPDVGTATLVDSEAELIATVRAFARGSAGHSHAHALHFTLRRRGIPVLIDPGTYTYVSDPAWRDRFRGTAAHNTVRLDGRDQADPAGPFRWSNPASCEILEWQPNPWRLVARCDQRGIRHLRRIVYADQALWVVDEIQGSGPHRIEQFWHLAGVVEETADGSILLPGDVRLLLSHGPAEICEGGDFGWESAAPGRKRALPLIRTAIEAELPVRMAAVFDFRSDGSRLVLSTDRVELGDRGLLLCE